MTHPVFHLTAPEVCPTAQRALIALDLRGAQVAQTLARQSTTRLTITRDGLADVALTSPLAMIEAIEELHPDHPLHPRDTGTRALHRDMISLGMEVQQRLSIVTRAKLTTELHLAILHLRTELARVEKTLKAGSYSHGRQFSNVDVVFAPTLWRLRLLDMRCATFLLSGFPLLADWARWISGHTALRATLSLTALQTYLAELDRRGAALVSPVQGDAWKPLTHSADRCGT